MKSISRFGPISPIFASTDDEEKAMRVQFARLCVLYDDLMLEFKGAQEEAIELFDTTSLNARRFYFVRRSLNSLFEIRGAIHALNMNKVFEKHRQWWDKPQQKQWDDAVKFFEQNHKFLKDWRNDIGGHFQTEAAAFAIDNLPANEVGVLEVYPRGNGVDIRIKFAFELVAAALVKGWDEKTHTLKDWLREAFTFLLDATKHVVLAVHTLMYYEVIPRMK